MASISALNKVKLDSLSTPPKNNLNAITTPIATDDKIKGYSEGSIWVYGGITYTCTDATTSKAVWASSADIFYFDSWATLIAAINAVGSTYINKYAVVSNANGGANSGATYVSSSGAVTNPIVDGNSATYKINTQGTIYSVTCQVRTVTNPVVTSVMLTANTKPTIAGYYIFAVIPTNGLPSGIGLNDITFFDGTNWSLYQKYSSAIAVLVAGTTTITQVTWRKFNGTWMSTADSYNPDGLEYQTGKVWNGKAVYRMCMGGTTDSSGQKASVMVIPKTGTVLLLLGTILRSNSSLVPFGGGDTQLGVDFATTGAVWIWCATASISIYANRPYTIWIEYTKS